QNATFNIKNKTTLDVKGDVLLAGANLNSGGTVEGNIGGNLKVESRADIIREDIQKYKMTVGGGTPAGVNKKSFKAGNARSRGDMGVDAATMIAGSGLFVKSSSEKKDNLVIDQRSGISGTLNLKVGGNVELNSADVDQSGLEVQGTITTSKVKTRTNESSSSTNITATIQSALGYEGINKVYQGGSIGPVAPKRVRKGLGRGARSLKNKIVGQTYIKKPTSTQATAPEKSTPVEQDNNKTPNENSQDEPSSEQDNNETPDQQQEDNTVTEQTETEQTNTPEESTPVTQDNNETPVKQQENDSAIKQTDTSEENTLATQDNNETPNENLQKGGFSIKQSNTLKKDRANKKYTNDTNELPNQASQQDSTLQNNNHTSNAENKGEATSQRGLPTDKESSQPKDTLAKNDRKKYDAYLIIQKGDDEIAKKAEQGITEKLNERHGKENVVVVKINKNGSQKNIQGNPKNLTGRTNAQIIGHGTKENGVRKLAGQEGAKIVENLKKTVPQSAELTKVSLVSCDSALCDKNNTSLVEDVEKGLGNPSTKVKGYIGPIDVNEKGKIIPVTEGGLSGRGSKSKENPPKTPNPLQPENAAQQGTSSADISKAQTLTETPVEQQEGSAATEQTDTSEENTLITQDNNETPNEN
ncbi:C80 family cysteine peptidase, partial [Bathymodiolus azoricus thioautotrophic gill symbiont]|uniref:C80 family cysteine peptidase n=1 Tax=Bathymodiolus azoricus thioautotrophic gill symbiont TaxID=235205 RepID=UPI000A4CE79B